MNNLDSYNGRGPFGAWIHRVALNHCRSHARKQSTRWRGMERMIDERAFQDLHWTPPGPLSRLELDEEISSLHDAISRLPVRQMKAIRLRCLEDRTVREVSQTMGVEEASVRSYVSRGIKKLGSFLREQGDGLS